MKNIYCIIIICCFAFIFPGCKMTLVQSEKNFSFLPTSYNGTADTSNAALLNWKEYYADPDLTRLIDTALKNNLDMLITMQKINVLRSNVKIAGSALFPMVSGVITGAQRKFGLYTMDGAGNISTEITNGQMVPIHLPDYYVGLQTAWEVDIWGKFRNKKKSTLAKYLAGVEGKNFTITMIVSETARLYYELLALDTELEIINETILLQTKALAVVEAQMVTGFATTLAVNQFEAQLLNSKALQLEVEQQIVESESAINFLLGRLPQPVIRKKEMFNVALPATINTGIPSALLQLRPDIRQAEYELLAARADVKAARAAFYPSLAITGAYGYQAFKTNFLFLSPQSIAYTILGSLAAPVINRNAIKREFKNANSNQQTAMYNYQKSIINGYIEVYNELSRIKKLNEIYVLKAQETASLTKGIEASFELYKAGRANYLEVLTSQKNTLETKLQLVHTKKMQHHAVINIYKALGGGWR